MTDYEIFGLSQDFGGADFDTSLTGTACYYMGNRTGNNAMMRATMQRTINRLEQTTSFEYTESAGNMPVKSISANFRPVNGIFCYGMYGKVAHTTADTKQTINVFTHTQARKPRYRFMRNYGTMYQQVNGVLIHDYNLSFVKQAKGSALECSVKGMGCTPLFTENIPSGVTYPTSKSSPFDLWTSCTWNSAEFTNLVNIDISASQTVEGIPSATTVYYEDILHAAPITTVVSVKFATDEATLWADYVAGTSRTFYTKFQKSTNSLHWVTLTGTAIVDNVDFQKEYDTLGWGTVSMSIASPTWVWQDYVDDDFYTIPT